MINQVPFYEIYSFFPHRSQQAMIVLLPLDNQDMFLHSPLPFVLYPFP